MTNRSKLRRLQALLAGLVLTCTAAWAQTPSPAVYTVEIIVFRNMSGAGGTEDWSAKPMARGPEKPDSPVTGRFVQSVPESQYQLNDVVAKLRNTSNYPPIAHFSWQQTASSWGSRAGFTIAKLAGDVPGLSGTIYLESGTYLHLGMALSYSGTNVPEALGAAPGTAFTINESQRVYPSKLSYFDHPAFGVVALVMRNKTAGGR